VQIWILFASVSFFIKTIGVITFIHVHVWRGL
jgi:hypothetical protein